MTTVEFLIAWADNTWTTETHEVPLDLKDYWGAYDDAAAVGWAQQQLITRDGYGQVALVAVYSYPNKENHAEVLHGET